MPFVTLGIFSSGAFKLSHFLDSIHWGEGAEPCEAETVAANPDQWTKNNNKGKTSWGQEHDSTLGEKRGLTAYFVTIVTNHIYIVTDSVLEMVNSPSSCHEGVSL